MKINTKTTRFNTNLSLNTKQQMALLIESGSYRDARAVIESAVDSLVDRTGAEKRIKRALAERVAELEALRDHKKTSASERLIINAQIGMLQAFADEGLRLI